MSIPEFPPTKNSEKRLRKACKIEVGVEPSSAATVRKYIHRAEAMHPTTTERETERWREGGEPRYSTVHALPINTMAEIRKVLSAEQSISAKLIHNVKGQGRGLSTLTALFSP